MPLVIKCRESDNVAMAPKAKKSPKDKTGKLSETRTMTGLFAPTAGHRSSPWLELAFKSDQRSCVVLQISLGSVLARHDVECLLSELKMLQKQTPSTVSTKAELQALCGRLQAV